jgi:hypothetical protein
MRNLELGIVASGWLDSDCAQTVKSNRCNFSDYIHKDTFQIGRNHPCVSPKKWRGTFK